MQFSFTSEQEEFRSILRRFFEEKGPFLNACMGFSIRFGQNAERRGRADLVIYFRPKRDGRPKADAIQADGTRPCSRMRVSSTLAPRRVNA